MAAVFLTVFGGNLTDQYNNMTASFGGSPGYDGKTQDEAKRQDGKNLVEGKALSDNATPQAGRKDVSVTLADGTVLKLKGYPADLASNVETVGVDGTSRQLSKSLEILAEQLKTVGKLDAVQYNALIDLAKEGNRAAEKQAKLAQVLTESQGNAAEYKKLLDQAGFRPIHKNVDYLEGTGPQTWLVGEFGWPLDRFKYTSMIAQRENSNISVQTVHAYAKTLNKEGDKVENLRSSLTQKTNSSADSITQRLLTLYAIAAETKALQDPSVKFMVNAATKDLVYLTNASASSYSAPEIAQNARTSRKDASVICKSGNGSSQSGIDCQ